MGPRDYANANVSRDSEEKPSQVHAAAGSVYTGLTCIYSGCSSQAKLDRALFFVVDQATGLGAEVSMQQVHPSWGHICLQAVSGFRAPFDGC